MVFPEDGESCLIDFDFVGKDSKNKYPNNYNCTLSERHVSAAADLPMKFIHDTYSLVKILEGVPIDGFLEEREDIGRRYLVPP